MNHSIYFNRYSLKTFTLIELLIVIAIISILAAMLMPALKNSVEIGKMVQCSSVERQTGIGFSQYTSDNHFIMPYVKGDSPTPLSTSGWDGESYKLEWYDPLMQYLDDGEDHQGQYNFLKCAKSENRGFKATGGDNSGSYAYNVRFNGTNINRCKKISKTFLMTDSWIYIQNDSWSWNFPNLKLSTHLRDNSEEGSLNLLFYDGHVEPTTYWVLMMERYTALWRPQ